MILGREVWVPRSPHEYNDKIWVWGGEITLRWIERIAIVPVTLCHENRNELPLYGPHGLVTDFCLRGEKPEDTAGEKLSQQG